MRRVALALVVLPLVLAACGGGKKSAGTPSDPLAAVKAAAAKTTAAGSEHLALVASVVTGGQTVSIKGAGGDGEGRLGDVRRVDRRRRVRASRARDDQEQELERDGDERSVRLRRQGERHRSSGVAGLRQPRSSDSRTGRLSECRSR